MSSRKRKTSSNASSSGKDDDYKLKRQRNNEAVNRTRQKKKQEEEDTSQKVEQLRAENTALERKVEGLQKELSFLKEMFVAYANKNKKDEGGGSDDGPSTSKGKRGS